MDLLQTERERLLAACKTALDLLSNLGQFHSSYCEICQQHAPKDYETGVLVGALVHTDDCMIGEIVEAVSLAERKP